MARNDDDAPDDAPDDALDDFLVEIGRRLKAARLATGLDQVDFKQWQIEANRLSMWENGKRTPSAIALLPFCDRFAISLDWLFRGNAALMPHELYGRIQEILSGDQPLPNGHTPGRKPREKT